MAWTEDRAAAWRAQAPYEYHPAPWLWAGVIMVLFAVISAASLVDSQPCGVQASDCGPDPVFAFILPLLVVTAALLLFLPWAAVLTSAVAAGVAVWFWFPTVLGVFLWPLLPVVLASWLWHNSVLARRQRRMARHALAPLPPSVVASLRRNGPQRLRWGIFEVLLLGVILAGALGAPFAYGAYIAEVDRDNQVRASMLQLDGTTVSTRWVGDGDEGRSVITVRVDEAVEGLGTEFITEPPKAMRGLGDAVSILVDPADPDRTLMADQPPDHTGLLGRGHLAAFAGLGALAVLIDRRRQSRRRGEPLVADQGIPVRVGPITGGSSIPVRCTDTDRTFAQLHLQVTDPLGEAQAPSITPAYLVGGLAAGDPARVVLETGEASHTTFLQLSDHDWVATSASQAQEERVDAVSSLSSGSS